MEVQALSKLFELSHMGIHLNLRDITEEDSLREPPGGANSINWVLGHIVMSRQLVLRLAGAEPIWDAQTASIYSGEDGVVFDRTRALPLERLLADLDASQARLMAALARVTPEALAAPVRSGTLADFLLFLAFHQGYHNGQLGLLRRLVGRPGVIKQQKGMFTT